MKQYCLFLSILLICLSTIQAEETSNRDFFFYNATSIDSLYYITDREQLVALPTKTVSGGNFSGPHSRPDKIPFHLYQKSRESEPFFPIAAMPEWTVGSDVINLVLYRASQSHVGQGGYEYALLSFSRNLSESAIIIVNLSNTSVIGKVNETQIELKHGGLSEPIPVSSRKLTQINLENPKGRLAVKSELPLKGKQYIILLPPFSPYSSELQYQIVE